MYQLKVIFIIIIASCFNNCQAQTSLSNHSLQLVTSIQLPNVSGRIDHLAFDNKNQLIVAAPARSGSDAQLMIYEKK
jgi:hypothetical protein